MSGIHVPGGNGPPPQELMVPVVVLNQVQIRIDTLPDGTRMLMIGPLALALPLNDQVEAWLNENLKAAQSGIVIAKPGMGAL